MCGERGGVPPHLHNNCKTSCDIIQITLPSWLHLFHSSPVSLLTCLIPHLSHFSPVSLLICLTPHLSQSSSVSPPPVSFITYLTPHMSHPKGITPHMSHSPSVSLLVCHRRRESSEERAQEVIRRISIMMVSAAVSLELCMPPVCSHHRQRCL